MFKVATNNYEEQNEKILAGDFSYAPDIIKAYPMLSWISEEDMYNIMRDVLYDTITYGECLQSFYEKDAQNGISPYYCEEYPDIANAKWKPNEEQLKMLRQYDSVYLIYEA
jgi:hypothetical protein